ncbi:hypothetical protein [Microbacterium sp. MYb64]|uniref:hypothetical protein n=1 Tax=Microbacterium sp. MYb64 TaxID=1848691 RepID=UPI000CFB5688|nr:hypothetical protein [Microbacterium sp. MYb64]PRB02293.1 hypothetical protein CQ044_15480 [Microbacterium sp. MYb64]
MTDEMHTPETEEQAERWTPDTDPDGYTLDDVDAKDWYLHTALNFIHGMDDKHLGSFGLTVTSNGVVVSGLAISRAEWITAQVELYKNAGVPDVAEHVEKLFTDAHEGFVKEAERRNEAGLPARVRGFVHMKDVRLGSGAATTQVPLWRGKLSDITGWSMGSWNSPQGSAETE